MIVRADARAIPLADASVQCVVTSPPYWGLRDYGVAGQIGLEATPEAYVASLVAVFHEVRRVLRDDGILWLNLGDCYAAGAGKVGECPGGGGQGARWAGDVDRLRDSKRGYRADRLANGRGDQPAILRKKTRATRDGSHAGKNTAIAALGPMTQPNRMPIHGLKPKDLIGIPWRVAFALQADGWWLRSDVVWHKPNPMPESIRDRPTKAHEYVFLLTKSEVYFYNYEEAREPYQYGRDHPRNVDNPPASHQPGTARHTGLRRSGNTNRLVGEDRGRPGSHLGGSIPWVEGEGRNARSVWTIGTQPYKGAHFAAFPEELVRRCILAGTGGGAIVLDPFAGTGTVVRVAQMHGRRGIGLELKPDYINLARERIAAPWPNERAEAERRGQRRLEA